jgi:hypothetical protein
MIGGLGDEPASVLTVDPVTFGQARLDEDRAAARACLLLEWRIGPVTIAGRNLEGTVDAHRTMTLAKGTNHDPEGRCLVHAARHDPARVLREVEAGRRILARHTDCARGIGRFAGELRDGIAVCDELADLLYRWADHPDYQPAWLPEDPKR